MLFDTNMLIDAPLDRAPSRIPPPFARYGVLAERTAGLFAGAEPPLG